ncbi:unnamed protein product [Macrosiphum euphorbiae]|uniref:Uncharacterized protein n=1 Tax=Macrosiphum euphorbiae TaxID=13131 RepID=A0AAV0W7K2_9HEMI|nr:unnamed protein product [Macrosiphum euphorbiae]
MQVLRKEENVYYDDCERKVYSTAPYLAKHLSCVSVAHDPCARVTIINDETLPYLAYYGPADRYKTSSESQVTTDGPVLAAFVPMEGVGEGRRGAFEEKPRGTRFLRPSAEPVRDIFAPAGRSRSTRNTSGITAAPTVVEIRQRRPQGHRPDGTSPPRHSDGLGGARA